MKYCAVYGCNSSSGGGISMFQFPRDKKLRQVWTFKTKRKNFAPSNHSCICCKHFTKQDYIQRSDRIVLRKGAVPSVFVWSGTGNGRKCRRSSSHSGSSTDTASEAGETSEYVNKSTQTIFPVSFGISYILSQKDESLLSFYTGFKDMETFSSVLDIILPGKNRQLMQTYHNSIKSETDVPVSDDNIFGSSKSNELYTLPDEGFRSEKDHNLDVEDEFLLVLMKLRLGLYQADLACRFNIAATTVSHIFHTWIQFMYTRLRSINCFPHRDVIMSAMKMEFKKENPSTMLIVDSTEIKMETPSSLVQQLKTSNSNSTNTMKCLIGADSLGAIMFVSQLFPGSVSNKELFRRSGLSKLLQHKIANGDLQRGDSIMADKEFDIEHDLDKIGLVLNQPPFLHTKDRFTTNEVVTASTIAKHRIHIERAISKIRQFHFFDKKVPIAMLYIINEIWSVCCMLSNFHPPLL